MASIDRYADAGARARGDTRANLAWLTESVTWFAAAVAGMLVVFIGLAVDAWRHNNGASEETLLSLGNPGHLVAGIGLAVTSAAVLAGFSIAAMKGARTAEGAIRRAVPVTVAWVVLVTVSIASVTYIGATGVTVGHSHDDANAVASDHTHTDAAGDAGVAAALQDEGIIRGGDPGGSGGSDPEKVEGALTQGSNGEANGGEHDHGKQPTFTQMETLSDDELLPLFPEGTVTKADLPAMREQIKQAHAVAEQLNTPEKAAAAGYVNTTSDVPFMGQHYLNFEYVRDGKFDPTKPEGLLFSKIDGGPEKLVGVWFLQVPGIGGVTREAEPAGFASNLDLWHAHTGLCLVGFSGASEGETEASCVAKGGRFTADLRWMMHVWVTPETSENPDGVFAYLNNDLFEKQQAAKKSTDAPSGVTQ
ncbi:MAG: hypothetical protein HY873_07775 [Chloroflexi bacterium]|nr:hypothetical protein [Chloroflexota bacterium]